MDSVTHVFLGGGIGMAAAGKRLGWRLAFFVGALAATVPDFDVFIRTGNTVTDHALHRSFMHALVMVPMVAGLSALPFMLWKRERWREIFVAAALATLSHPLLDVLTSYGTQLLWPFSNRRYSLDVVAVVDAAYTVILIAGVAMSLWRKSIRGVAVGLALSTAYLGIAFVQHWRASAVQAQLIALRGQTGLESARVLPEVGATLNYRSVYVHEGKIFADAVRVPWFGRAQVKVGGSVEVAKEGDLAEAEHGNFETFAWFADGFVARDEREPGVIGDVRYTATLNGFDAVWGVEFLRDGPVWRMFTKRRYVGALWRDLVRPQGFVEVDGQERR